jgi:aspartyl/asparaginyl beta-hydroxylase
VRNPWDWYVSMFFDYRRKQQYIYQIISDEGALNFVSTVSRFLNLGDNTVQSKRLLDRLVDAAPTIINPEKPGRRGKPGLRSEHFANFPENVGYYSWLFQLMYESKNNQCIHIGRFENLREEALRLFELTGTPITDDISSYLKAIPPLNSSPRPNSFNGYPPELKQLVADKEKYLVERYYYNPSIAESGTYPKTDYFNHLGAANVDALIERLKRIPESLWELENEGKPNKFDLLNDTQHIVLRYINEPSSVFDFHDLPIWDEWKEVLLPIMEQAAKALGYKNYRFPRVMLARLPAGSEISEHTDGDANHYIHKIHVPLSTNPDTIFYVGKQERHLPVGEIMEVNNKRMHAVKNDGELDRIHFIFECYNMDDYGKSSSWWSSDSLPSPESTC